MQELRVSREREAFQIPAPPTQSLMDVYKATWKREFKLPWRKAGLLISMMKWTRTSKLSIKISLLDGYVQSGYCVAPYDTFYRRIMGALRNHPNPDCALNVKNGAKKER